MNPPCFEPPCFEPPCLEPPCFAFGDRAPIVRDARLRECDYGELTRKPAREIDPLRLAAIDTPFPGGESYTQATARVAACLDDLRKAWPGGWVLLIGHRATHYALDHLLSGIPLAAAITAPFVWQPGWRYELRPEHLPGLPQGM